MPPRKLLWSNIVARPVRTALTVAAIGLSVSLVVAVTSGYASVESAALAYLNRYLGSADAEITRPESTTDGLIPERLDVQLAKDHDIHRATSRLDVSSNLFDKDGKVIETSGFHIVGIHRPQDSRIDSLVIESGQWFDSSLGNVAVVDQVAASDLHVKVGDSFSMSTEIGRQRMQVVGIVHKPELMAMAAKTIYVPLETLQQFQKLDGGSPQVSRIDIDLETGADIDAFATRWNQKLAEIDQAAATAAGHPVAPMRLRLVRQDRSRMDLDLRSVHILSYLGDAISLLAATFIIFSSLAMGVSERQRALAMLRAIGATRTQVAGLVILEGLLMTAGGAVVGVPLGIFWTECLRLLFSDFFVAGVTISMTGIALGVSGALIAALGASILPAWSASRLAPLEAMSPLGQPHAAGPPLGWTILGLLLIGIDPAIFYIPWEKLIARLNLSSAPEAETNLLRFYAHHTVGAEGLFFGFFLIAPLLIWLMERFLAPVVARSLRLPPALLRQQLSHGLWRSAGAAAALMVGLAALVALTTQGTSMLDGWKLPDKFPDIFLVSLRLGGLSQPEWQKLGNVPGIRHFPDGQPELLPIAVTISGLGSNPLALVGAVLAPTASGTLFFGVPPQRALAMMELDFRDDNGHSLPPDQQAIYAKEAERELQLPRHIIVTEDFRRLHHIHYGSKISLFSESQKYEYTICGIVWSPGLDVIVSVFDLGRQFDQRTAGMVFGSIDDAERDFGADRVNIFAANLELGVEKEKVMDQIRQNMGDLNMKAGDVRAIKSSIDGTFRRLMALMTTVAFSAMAVASMGVTNTIMASVRSRRWQLGILRSIGLQSDELLRLVLAEAFLLGLAGLFLGLGCGAILSLTARELEVEMLGYLPPVVIPWGYIILGSAAVMFVSIAAALWPAMTVSRTQPLALLQAGRAAT